MVGVRNIGSCFTRGLYSLNKQQMAGIVLLTAAVAIAAMTVVFVPGLREVIPLAGRATLFAGGLAIGAFPCFFGALMVTMAVSNAMAVREGMLFQNDSDFLKKLIYIICFPGYVKPASEPVEINTKNDVVALLKPKIDELVNKLLECFPDLCTKDLDLSKKDPDFTFVVSREHVSIKIKKKAPVQLAYKEPLIQDWMLPFINNSEIALNQALTPPTSSA